LADQSAAGLIFRVSREACVECGVCLDAAKCPSGALSETFGPEEEIKKLFGRLVTAQDKKTSGRLGSRDLKTCDAKGGLPPDTVQTRLELGRPVGPPRLGQVGDFIASLGGFPVRPQSSYLSLLVETANGPALPPELKDLTVLTVCLEADLAPSRAGELVAEAKGAAEDLGLSLSVNLLAQPGLLPALASSLFGRQTMGPRVKANLGLAWPAHEKGHVSPNDPGGRASGGCDQ
jgi:hypothetical protein